MFGAGWRCRPPWPFMTTLGFQNRCQSRLTSSSKWRSVKGLNLRWLFSHAAAFQADPLPLWQHCIYVWRRAEVPTPMAIDATHSFRNWCQSRLTSPGIWRFQPDSNGRSRICNPQPYPSWPWNRMAPSRGFEPLPTGSKPIVLPLHQPGMVREVRFELTCLSAPGFEPDTYTSSVTRACGACRGTRTLNPFGLRF